MLVNRGPSRLDRATKVCHQMVAVKKNLEALAGFTKPCGASRGFSSTAAVFSIMLKSSNWPQRYLTLRICRQYMQAVKYSELWQIRGRGAWISDPLQIGFSSSEQILFDSENYSQGIYYGKVKSVGGQSSCKSRALFGCDFN